MLSPSYDQSHSRATYSRAAARTGNTPSYASRHIVEVLACGVLDGVRAFWARLTAVPRVTGFRLAAFGTRLAAVPRVTERTHSGWQPLGMWPPRVLPPCREGCPVVRAPKGRRGATVVQPPVVRPPVVRAAMVRVLAALSWAGPQSWAALSWAALSRAGLSWAGLSRAARLMTSPIRVRRPPPKCTQRRSRRRC